MVTTNENVLQSIGLVLASASSESCEETAKPVAETMIIDEKLARLRAHRNNIHRYRRLLATGLTDLERSHVERRLEEEQSAMHALSAGTFPFVLPSARPLSGIHV